MKRLKLIVSLLILLSVFSITSSAKTKDVFVLVDVSGTMNNNSVNQEAKLIIREYLIGNRSLDSWENNGWKSDRNWDSSIPNACIESGSYICLIPFGNINRVQDWKDYRVSDRGAAGEWLDRVFPTRHTDSYTYLELGKAYIGALALTRNISSAYVLLYSDGMPESVKQQYNKDDQDRVDDLQHAGVNGMEKLGILRKYIREKHYDIEVWRFNQYNTVSVPTDKPIENDTDTIILPPPPPTKFRINYPKNEGLNEKHSLSVKQEEPFSIGWNESGASVIISQKKDGSWRKINGKDIRNYYSIGKQANSAKITFLESGDYKIMVRGEHGSDERYVSVSSDFLKLLLPILLILLAVVGAVFAYQKFFKKPDSWDDNDGGHKSKNSMNNTSSNDDW